MSADPTKDDEKDERDSDRTRIGVPGPAPPKLPGAGAPRPSGSSAPAPGPDDTHAASGAPPFPKLPPKPAAAPPASPAVDDDRTRVAAAPPPLPRAAGTAPAATPPAAKPPPPPAAQPAARPAQPAAPEPARAAASPAAPAARPATEDDEEKTVFVSVRRGATMQRVQPPGRSEMVSLQRPVYVLGRAHGADIALYSASASREHARIVKREERWFVVSLPGKSVIANGAKVKGERQLTHKMRVQLGEDEFVFFDETAPAAEEEAAADEGSGPAAGKWLTSGLIRMIGIAAILAAVILALIRMYHS